MKLKILFLLILTGIWVFWPGTGRRWAEVNVVEGQNAHDVLRQLMSTGVAKSKYPFLIWVKVRRAETRLQIGRYRISVGRSAYWVVDDLIQGRTEKARVVIPEGFSSWQIADRLEGLKLCDAEKFKEYVTAQHLEGYLFPATYEIPYGLSVPSITQKFTAEFHARWTDEFETRAKELGMTKAQVITLASIIEREVRMRDELPLVSSVYHNRLKKKMRLEADPTVQYGLGYWKSRLTYDDYRKTKSPYNTYLYGGLPPGPICSPGHDAVNAALWPAQSAALFFVAKEDGYHTFSDTYREHTNKVNKRNREKK